MAKVLNNIINIIFTQPLGVISTITLLFTMLTYNRGTKQIISGSRTKYTDKIFDKYLMDKIPHARDRIKFTDDPENNGLIEFADVISSMRSDTIFFKFKDKKFYDKIDEKLLKLEEFIEKNMNINDNNGDAQATFNSTVNIYITEIYEIISKYSSYSRIRNIKDLFKRE